MNEPRKSERGFTLVELMLAIVVLLPILAAIGNGTSVVSATVDANVRQADVTAFARRTAQHVAQFLRPGKLSTILVPAIQQDVTAGLATSVGEWISPTDGVWRPGIEFVAAAGLLSMNAALNTTPRRMQFEIEPGETQNGVDDDGDGLVDEGSLTLEQNGSTITVVRDIELCDFSIDGRTVTMRLRTARRDSKQRVYRAVVEQHFYLRNN